MSSLLQKIRNSSKEKKRIISITLSFLLTIIMAIPYFYFSYFYIPTESPVAVENISPLASIGEVLKDGYEYITEKVVDIFNNL